MIDNFYLSFVLLISIFSKWLFPYLKDGIRLFVNEKVTEVRKKSYL